MMTLPTTIYSQGEVVLIRFPFTNGVGEKQRPALVISGVWHNRNRTDCIFASITSAVRIPIEQDQLHIIGKEVQEAGLAKESVILLGQIFTLEHSRIVRRLGRINRSTLTKVYDCLRSVYDIH
jgi:mRNA interferase MazF